MHDYITLEQLCRETGISKYRLKLLQELGYFEAKMWALRKPPCDGCHFDRRWLTVWQEALEYQKVGFDELSALYLAHGDVFVEE